MWLVTDFGFSIERKITNAKFNKQRGVLVYEEDIFRFAQHLCSLRIRTRSRQNQDRISRHGRSICSSPFGTKTRLLPRGRTSSGVHPYKSGASGSSVGKRRTRLLYNDRHGS